MSANVEAMVREGINAVKSGRKDEARALLTKAVEIDAYNAEAWLWLSGVVESEDDQRTCLENVLAIDPTNTRARQGLDYILNKSPSPASQPMPPTAEPTSSPPAAFAASSVTSVEWDYGALETSSPSAAPPAVEPSAQDYDDWVSGLNLPAQQEGEAAGTETAAAFSSASPFVGFEDDIFESGPFGESQDFDIPIETDPPARPVAAPATTIAYRPPPSLDDEIAASSQTSPTPPAAAIASKVSPTRDDGIAAAFRSPVDYGAYGVLDNVVEAEIAHAVAGEMFPNIPKAIPPTRLPGTKEGQPANLVVLAILLLLINIVVSVLVVLKLLTPA